MFLLTLISTNIYIQILSLIVIVVFLDIAFNIFVKNFKKVSQKTANKIDDIVINSIHYPLRVMLWCFFLIILYDLLSLYFDWHTQRVKSMFLVISMSIVAILFVFRVFKFTEIYLIEKVPDKKDSISLIIKIIKIFIIFIIFIGCIQSLGYEVSAILTFGGLGGMVIAFAAKDMLANIFSGLMLQIDRPFDVGDWIRISEKNIEGIVEKVGWRITVVRTFSKNPIYVPNAFFSTVSIETPSRMINRRIYQIIGIRYQDINKLEKIIIDIRKYLNDDEDIDKKQIIMVNFNKFNEYSVDFFVYTFTITKNWQKYHMVKEKILFNINKIITAHKAEIAYPTTVYIKEKEL